MFRLLTLLFPVLGIKWDMYYHVPRNRGWDIATFSHGQDVLCTLSEYRFVPQKTKGRESRLTRFEGASVIVATGQSIWPSLVSKMK